MQGSLSIERMCQLAGVSRAGFYRSLQEEMPAEEDMEVRSAIQQIAVEHRRRYGYRRISAELRRRGMLVNHKRVLRIIREDNLLAVQPRAFVVTTDSDHEFEVYLNLRQSHETDGNESALGSGYYLYPFEEGVCLPGRHSRRVFAESSGLGVGPDTREPIADRGAGTGHCPATAPARFGASFRPRRAVRFRRLRESFAKATDDPEHESAGEPL